MPPTFDSLCLQNMTIKSTVVLLFTEYYVARGILKSLCKTWEFRATSYSVNSQGIIAPRFVTNNFVGLTLTRESTNGQSKEKKKQMKTELCKSRSDKNEKVIEGTNKKQIVLPFISISSGTRRILNSLSKPNIKPVRAAVQPVITHIPANCQAKI